MHERKELLDGLGDFRDEEILSPLWSEFLPTFEALVMATLAVMDDPRPPISLVWADVVRDYESLGDVGVDLEFVIESEYLTSDEPRPFFSDRDGRRFRILVMSLEVVLCIVVPEDFEPEQLTIQSVQRDDEELIVESLNGRPHRVLSAASGGALPIDGMTSALTRTASSLVYSGGSPNWLDFDRAWLESVDPAPPISPLQWVRNRVFRLFRSSR